MVRIYLMPIIVDADGDRVVKYQSELPGYSAMDYGNEPVALVASDVTGPQHSALAAHPDVIAVPADLNSTIGGALGQAQAALEAFNVPADWLTSGMTWRVAVGGVARIFQLAQRVQGHGWVARILSGGVDLSTQFGDLPFDVRAHLIVMADSFGFDRSGINASSTLRQILRALAVQWTPPILLRGMQL